MEKAEEVFDLLREVKFPGLDKDIVTLGYVKALGREGERWKIRMEISTTDAGVAQRIEEKTREVLSARGLSFDLEVSGPYNTSKTEPEPPKVFLKEDLLAGIDYKIAVASGKGGVGKSTVAVNLALALARSGASVGLLDADIYGPSVPTMLGISDLQLEVGENEKIIPREAYGLKVVSLGLAMSGLGPVIWRGPLASRAVEQLMGDVNWSGVSHLVLDLPPGTGDIQISISQKARLSGAVIVTTPQDVALVDAIRGVKMFTNKNVDVPVLGVVENMSYFECPHCGKRSDIFPRGTLTLELERLGVEILGRVPVDPSLAVGGDTGEPIVVREPDSTAARAFMEVAGRVVEKLRAGT